MLGDYRVIDLTNEGGMLCGQILADLGADVVQVEPPGGSSARRVGPWLDGLKGPENSLFWAAYARNKRSIVLDLASEKDRETLRDLAARADFWIESERPGRLAPFGLGYDDLAELNPGLVYVSITPFGQDGPKAGWAATDLTQCAAGGTAYLSGEPKGPPVRVSVPQAHAHAGTDAAVGAMIAHAERLQSGRGQHVDVSQQQSVTLATMFRVLDVPLEQVPARRLAGGAAVGKAFLSNRYPLADGWVTLGPAYLPSTGHFQKRLLSWVAEEGFCDPALVEEDWGTYGLRLFNGDLPPEAWDPVDEALTKFFATRTKADLMAAAVERKLLLAPVLGLGEILDSAQLASRSFLTDVPHHDRVLRHPGPFARFGESPIQYQRGAPRLDEHGDDVRREIEHTAKAPAIVARAESPRAPLEGVRILDLFWVLAGPGSTRMLADYGATVVRVESTRHLDTLRAIPPYRFSNPHHEGAGGFQCANVNKLGMTLDLARPEAREVVFDLVRWADVVTESFAPGVIDHYGLGWKTLREIKPDLIMISSCLMGQTGPWKNFTGFGGLAASLTGFQELAGWPENPPSGPYGAYTDFVAVRYNAIAILAALEHRRRTGQGQHIDQSQAEAALHFLTPAILEYTAHGRVRPLVGNVDEDLSPHGIFPAAGDDRWLAIAVRSDDEWRALCGVLARPDLIDARRDSARVEDAITAWTGTRDAQAAAEKLQAVGIPSHPVSDTAGLFADPQIQHRGHFIEIEGGLFPTTTVESTRLRLSRSAARTPQRALTVGRDTEEILKSVLGYDDDRMQGLAAAGALGSA